MKPILNYLTLLIIGAAVVIIGAYMKIQGKDTPVLMIGLILEALAIAGLIFRYYRKRLSKPE